MSCLHNRRHQRQAASAPAYYPAPGPYYGGNPEMMMRPIQGLGVARGMYPDQQYQNLQAEEHRHKRNEHRAEMGALGTAVFAAYEKPQEKVDPAHAQRHHMEVQAAEAATLGLGVYALHEHHEAHKMHKAEKHERHHNKHDHHHCH